MTAPLRELSRARVAWMLVALLTAIHAAVEWLGGYQEVADWYVIAGLSRAGLMHGYAWQLLSYGFLHGSWFHLLCNIIFLLLMGSRIEFMLGGVTLLKVFLLGIIGGGLCHLLLGSSGENVLVGASAGCVALLLLTTTLSPQSRMAPLPLSAKNLGAGVLLGSLFLSLFQPGLHLPFFAEIGRTGSRIFGEDLFQVGHACHLGGALSGWLHGHWMLRRRIDLNGLRADRARREKNSRSGL